VVVAQSQEENSSMPNPTDRPLFADVRSDLNSLGVELREMAAARWELARLEIGADLRATKRLAILWLAALVLLLTSLPLAIAGLAEALAGWHNIPRLAWLLIFAAVLLLSALIGGYLAWRRFQRNFVGLRETFEELREDAVWLKESVATDANATENKA
jgi:hypothetical protein